MEYISPNDEYPRYIGDVQLDDPNYVKGAELPAGWREVLPTDRPPLGENEVHILDFPVEEDGVWKQSWSVRKLTTEEISRREAPKTARAKLEALGFTADEIFAIVRGRVI